MRKIWDCTRCHESDSSCASYCVLVTQGIPKLISHMNDDKCHPDLQVGQMQWQTGAATRGHTHCRVRWNDAAPMLLYALMWVHACGASVRSKKTRAQTGLQA
eukprot:1463225-Pleurochrysis_carterae.AAC.3